MKHSVFYVFIVIQAMVCDKPVLKHNKEIKTKEYCLQKKCVPVKDAKCVRIKRYDKKLAHHVIVENNCEMDYLECNNDLIAKTVPMKYCSNNAGRTKKNKNKNQHIRVKGRALQPKPSITPVLRKGVKQKISKKNNTRYTQLKSSRVNRKKQLRWKNNNSKAKGNILNTKQSKGFEKQARQSFQYPFSSETESDFENNEQKKLEKGIAGYLVNADTGGMVPKSASSNVQPKAFGPPRNYRLLKYAKHNKPVSSGYTRPPPEPLFAMFSMESTNGSLGKADMEQYDEPCPTVCPTRSAMVCAQCQHGIYRSFSSVCHVRMFGCNHPEEVMTLVSRIPCIVSSPFLSEKSMKPQGRIEDQDDDIVLRFIKCREAGLLVYDGKLLRKKKNKKKDVPRSKGTLRKHRPYKRNLPKVHAYNYINKFNTWYDAKFACEHSDAHLFYPRTSREARNIYNKFFKIKEVKNAKYPDYVYVGIFVGIDREFVTINGEPISEVYENWAPGQPDNKKGDENCVAMNSRYEYHDVSCNERLSFICARPASNRLHLRNSSEKGDFDQFVKFIEYIFGDSDEYSGEDSNEDSDEYLDDSDEYLDDSDDDYVEDSDKIYLEDSDDDNVEDSDDDKVEDSDKFYVEDSVEDNVEDSDDDNVEDSVEDNVEDSVGENGEDSVEGNIQNHLRDPRCNFGPDFKETLNTNNLDYSSSFYMWP